MKKTAAFVLLALLSNSSSSQATHLDKTHRISADSFSNVGEEDNGKYCSIGKSVSESIESNKPFSYTASSLMKMGSSEAKPTGTQSMAQQQVSADLVSMSGTLKKIQEHQNKMDEILETADREMNLGKKELENIE